MVVESCEVEGSEAIVFLVIDTTRGRETGKKQAQSSNVTPGERGERREEGGEKRERREEGGGRGEEGAERGGRREGWQTSRGREVRGGYPKVSLCLKPNKVSIVGLGSTHT